MPASGTATDNGNLLALVSSYTGNDGSTHDMADVWLQRDVHGHASAPATQVSVDDVLTAPVASIDLAGVVSHSPAEDTSSAASSGTASAAAPASTTDAVDSTLATAVATAGLLDDPTRHILI
jgi:hypothetical protein